MIDNPSITGEEILFFSKRDLEVVIGSLLPVFGAGSSRGYSRIGRGWPYFLLLAEWILMEFNRVAEACGYKSNKDYDKFHE